MSKTTINLFLLNAPNGFGKTYLANAVISASKKQSYQQEYPQCKPIEKISFASGIRECMPLLIETMATEALSKELISTYNDRVKKGYDKDKPLLDTVSKTSMRACEVALAENVLKPLLGAGVFGSYAAKQVIDKHQNEGVTSFIFDDLGFKSELDTLKYELQIKGYKVKATLLYLVPPTDIFNYGEHKIVGALSQGGLARRKEYNFIEIYSNLFNELSSFKKCSRSMIYPSYEDDAMIFVTHTDLCLSYIRTLDNIEGLYIHEEGNKHPSIQLMKALEHYDFV